SKFERQRSDFEQRRSEFEQQRAEFEQQRAEFEQQRIEFERQRHSFLEHTSEGSRDGASEEHRVAAETLARYQEWEARLESLESDLRREADELERTEQQILEQQLSL